MDATEEGGIIEIQTSREDFWLRIDFRDDGQGVPEHLQARIFRPYFTTKATGTGLGLFVSRNIVEQNGGRIELSKTSPEGTTFSVYLECGEEAGESTDSPLGIHGQNNPPDTTTGSDRRMPGG